MGKGNSNTVVVGRNGDRCPRCGQRTEIREHRNVTAKELAKPFYYARWFICVNRRCKTTMIMREEHKVWNGGGMVETPSVYRDMAIEVLDDMKTAGCLTWPPWEEGPKATALVFGDFWKRWHDGKWAGIEND
jgi:hypothetical protein